MRIGLISDTHGLMRAEALGALAGVEMILHAGDVGRQSVLRELEAMAPVRAVYGNVDDPIFGLPQHLDLTLDGVRVHVSHGHELGSPTPATLAAAYPADVIVYGHTHRQLIEIVAGRLKPAPTDPRVEAGFSRPGRVEAGFSRPERTLVINPGAAGPRRFNLAPSVAILTIENGAATAEILPLPH